MAKILAIVVDDDPYEYGELAELVYNTPTPTRGQRETVARACRNLVMDGYLEMLEGRMPVTRRRTSATKSWEETTHVFKCAVRATPAERRRRQWFDESKYTPWRHG